MAETDEEQLIKKRQKCSHIRLHIKLKVMIASMVFVTTIYYLRSSHPDRNARVIHSQSTKTTVNKTAYNNSGVIHSKSTKTKVNTTDYIHCFRDNNLDSIRLEEVLQSNRKPRKDKTIFFHVTNCSPGAYLSLNGRQSCAVESAAMMNPNIDVFVLFASPTVYPLNLTPPGILSLQRYPNIFFRNNNLWNYTEGTPAEKWFQSNVLFGSKFLTVHLSDLLRLITLWRWGGIYMDLDVIVKESFEEIPLNFAGTESEKAVSNAVMSFESFGFGHYIVDLILKRFVNNFRGDIWGHNGPSRITDVLKNEICQTNNIKNMTDENCHGFQVFPTNRFYPIYYKKWDYFFKEQYLNTTLEIAKDSLLVHVWNKMSKDFKFKVGTRAAYGVYAEKFCPFVYSSIGKYF